MQRSWILMASLMLMACNAAEDERPLGSASLGSASCEAWVDRELERCPQNVGTPAEAIEQCEANRRDDDLIGCEEPYARFVICMTNARDDVCQSAPNECGDELGAMIACSERFTQATGCSRVPHDDVCVGQPQPHSFSCVGEGPAGCGPDIDPQTEAQPIFNGGIRCCPSFAADGASYFADPK